VKRADLAMTGDGVAQRGFPGGLGIFLARLSRASEYIAYSDPLFAGDI
jgi:hypothetical protein